MMMMSVIKARLVRIRQQLSHNIGWSCSEGSGGLGDRGWGWWLSFSDVAKLKHITRRLRQTSYISRIQKTSGVSLLGLGQERKNKSSGPNRLILEEEEGGLQGGEEAPRRLAPIEATARRQSQTCFSSSPSSFSQNQSASLSLPLRV